jgi:hypothetical protein
MTSEAMQVPTFDWDAIWEAAARRLAGHVSSGLTHLLTEDVLRFAVIQELVEHGVPPLDIEQEWRRPGVTDSVDLVLKRLPPAAIEFKFPREPRETNAAWTQHLGEALKDFFRVATMPAEFGDRWCVQLWSTRVVRYFDGAADRYGFRWGNRPGDRTVFDPDAMRTLPATALGRLARWSSALPEIRATCTSVCDVGADMRLYAFAVNPVVIS